VRRKPHGWEWVALVLMSPFIVLVLPIIGFFKLLFLAANYLDEAWPL